VLGLQSPGARSSMIREPCQCSLCKQSYTKWPRSSTTCRQAAAESHCLRQRQASLSLRISAHLHTDGCHAQETSFQPTRKQVAAAHRTILDVISASQEPLLHYHQHSGDPGLSLPLCSRATRRTPKATGFGTAKPWAPCACTFLSPRLRFRMLHASSCRCNSHRIITICCSYHPMVLCSSSPCCCTRLRVSCTLASGAAVLGPRRHCQPPLPASHNPTPTYSPRAIRVTGRVSAHHLLQHHFREEHARQRLPLQEPSAASHSAEAYQVAAPPQLCTIAQSMAQSSTRGPLQLVLQHRIALTQQQHGVHQRRHATQVASRAHWQRGTEPQYRRVGAGQLVGARMLPRSKHSRWPQGRRPLASTPRI
jgi:hypothetical protein